MTRGDDNYMYVKQLYINGIYSIILKEFKIS